MWRLNLFSRTRVNDPKENNDNCTMMKIGRLFTTITEHLTPAAVKSNKSVKVSFDNKEHIKE